MICLDCCLIWFGSEIQVLELHDRTALHDDLTQFAFILIVVNYAKKLQIDLESFLFIWYYQFTMHFMYYVSTGTGL